MKQSPAIQTDKLLYYRLIALWVFCESVLGGIIHGLKLPVSGLIVGSCAVICICFIARYVHLRQAILKATVIVAIFKMMLSPHSPPTAYIAVFFQGLAGQLIFNTRNFYKLSCIVFGIIALAESAVQRILIMTIVFGNNIWKAIDETLSKLFGQGSTMNYSLALGIGYLLLHILTGFAAGLFAYNLTSENHIERKDYIINDEVQQFRFAKRKRKFIRAGLLIVWLALLFIVCHDSIFSSNRILPTQLAGQIIIRSMLIVLTWYFIISPLLLRFMHNWLQNIKQKQATDIKAIASLLPSTQALIYASWKLSGDEKGIRRIRKCFMIVLRNTLHSHE